MEKRKPITEDIYNLVINKMKQGTNMTRACIDLGVPRTSFITYRDKKILIGKEESVTKKEPDDLLQENYIKAVKTCYDLRLENLNLRKRLGMTFFQEI